MNKKFLGSPTAVELILCWLKKSRAKANMRYAYDYYCPSSDFRSLMVIKISSFLSLLVAFGFIQEIERQGKEGSKMNEVVARSRAHKMRKGE
jgi:hypothetical protein